MSKLVWVAVVVGVLGCGPIAESDAGVTADAGRAVEIDSLGYVRALTFVIPSTAPSPRWGTELTAEFLNPDDYVCSREEFGSCVRFQCKSVTATFGPRTTAGRVSVGSASFSHSLEPSDGGMYPISTGVPEAWSPAEPIHISAAGRDGGVPSFTAELVGPPKIQVTSPADFTSSAFPDVSVDTPYRVAWTGGEGTTVAVFISGGGALGMSFCTAPGADGVLEVPVSLLQQLRGSSGFIAIGTESRVELQAGRWTVLAHALWCGETRNGAAYTGARFR